MPVHVGANSLKNPHHIIILQFSEVVKGHANYVCTLFKGNQLLFFISTRITEGQPSTGLCWNELEFEFEVRELLLRV